MPTYTDEEGNQIEIETPLAELQERAQKAQELEEQQSQLEKELEDLRSKDKNFKGLRRMSQKEKEEIESQYQQRLEALENQIKERDSLVVSEAKNDWLKSKAGEDEGLKKKLEEAYSLFNMPESTPAQIKERAAAAERYVFGQEQERPNPFRAPSSSYPSIPSSSSKKSFADKPEGRSLATSLQMGWAKEEQK